MIVAVSMRVTEEVSYSEPRDAISHDWIRLLDGFGVTPIPVPNVLRGPAAYLSAVGAQGLILTGGNDLGEIGGGSPPPGASSERDRSELALLDGALDLGLPVLGVCRGLELINIHFGGQLVRDLSGLGEHVATTHPVDLVAAPTPTVGAGVRIETNSFHRNGVLVGGVASALEPFALAAGGVVEGLRHPGLRVLALQWHPERENPAAELDRMLLADWLALCG